MLDIPKLVDEAKAAKIKVYPQHVNRASNIGHPCERHLTYCRTAWEQKKPHDVGLQYIFDLGNLYEQAFLQDLREAGLTIEEQQASFFDKRYNLSGHIDGKIPLDGRRYPIEAKSMNPYAWESINSLEDIRRAKQHYVRGYEDQLLCYEFLHNEELGILFLVNKVSGRIKQINVTLDYQRMEEIIQKCERINAHVTAGTLPDRIPWDDSISGRCAFQEICYPDRDFGEGIEIILDDELETMLNRRSELQRAAKEYEELDKAIKKNVANRPHLLIGTWEILGKLIQKKGYEVKPQEYWQVSIRLLTKQNEAQPGEE